MQPGPEFYEEKDEKDSEHAIKGLRFFARYLRPYKSQLWQLVAGMMVGSVLQLIFPFLTQAMVDTGIGTSNLNFITLILVAQLVLFATQLGVNFIRSWIVLHMNTRVNITLISDFLAKLMKLPMSFFDTKMVGDIMQRIGDHGRIQGFLTCTSLSVIFSFVNFIIFGIILAYYNPLILLVFAIGNTFYVLWILSFMKFRRELDHRRFAQASSEQSTVVQLVTGMQEIKLSNCEKQKRWQWERIQVKLFKISIRGLALGQYQELGSVFFNQATGILISFIAAKSVVDGDMTLGMMMSQSYIIGQLSLQDAKISLERLNEIHNREDEEQTVDSKLTVLPDDKTFNVENLYFSYDGADRDYVLEDVNLKIPYNKITAIVGASGSGKTTLVKLLLAYYQPNKGNINLGETPIKNINPSAYTPNNLTEIGWGINYLIKNRFVDAGASVLEEVDTFLCKLKHEDILSKTDSSYPFFSKDLYLMDRGYSTELLKISLLELKELLGQKDRRFHLCYLNSILYTILQMNTDTELYNTVLNILYTNIVNSIGNKYYFPVDVLVLSGIIQSFNLRRNSVTEDEKWTGLLEALDCSNTGGMIFNTGIYDLIYCKLKITKYLFNKLEITDMEKQVNFMVKDVNRNLSLHSGLAGIGLTLINNIVDNNNI